MDQLQVIEVEVDVPHLQMSVLRRHQEAHLILVLPEVADQQSIDLVMEGQKYQGVQVVVIVLQQEGQVRVEDQIIVGPLVCKGHQDLLADQAVARGQHQDQVEVIHDQARKALGHPILLLQVAHQVALAVEVV